MNKEQAVQDVAMIARNGIDRIIELEGKLSRTKAVADDLAMLVSKLAHALRKAAPDNGLPGKALDYLKRSGMAGQVLRQGTAENSDD